MLPSAAYNAKPAPIHSGDFDAVGFSTAFMTSAGYGLLVDRGSGQSGAAAKPAAPFASGGLASQAAGLAVLVAVLYYVDKRIAR
jgi:hypothetical protein